MNQRTIFLVHTSNRSCHRYTSDIVPVEVKKICDIRRFIFINFFISIEIVDWLTPVVVYKLYKRGKLRNCPMLKKCSYQVTKKYFVTVCNSISYYACVHYAKKRKELLTPINWLKKLAIIAEEKK